jgi:hypothetical protein
MNRTPFAFSRLLAVASIVLIASCSDDSPFDPGNGGNDTIPGPNPTDTIAPSIVVDGSLRVLSTGDVAIFEWSAPHDNEAEQSVDHYEIRYAYTLGNPPPAFWDGLSTPVLDPPVPASPGSRQTYVFTGLDLGRELWVGIRSYDATGNHSPGSDLATAHVPGIEFSGRCIDALTHNPIEGLTVWLGSGTQFNLVTDENGEFMMDDLLPGGSAVVIRTGSAASDYHRLSQVFYLTGDSTHTFAMVPFQLTVAPQLGGMSMLEFVKTLTETLPPNTVLAKWHNYPVPVYIPPFVNNHGVDYEALSKAAAQRWMDRSGTPLFTFVDSKPDTGIVLKFKSHEDMPVLIGITRHTVGTDSHPIMDEIWIRNNAEALGTNFIYKVILHEFGHTIRFGHIDDSVFIMHGGQPLPDDISDDEVNAVRLHYGLPTRVNMDIYATDTAALSANN